MGKFRDNPAAANVSPIKSTIAWNAKDGVFIYYHYESKTKFEATNLEFYVVEPSLFRIGCSSSMRSLPYKIRSNYGIMGENDIVQIIRDDNQQVLVQGAYAKNKALKDVVNFHKGRYESCVAGYWVSMIVKKPDGTTEVRKNDSKEMAIFKLHGGAISESWGEFEKRTGEKMGDLDGKGLQLGGKHKGTSQATTAYWYPTIQLHPGFKLKDGNTMSFELFFETRFMDDAAQKAGYKELRTYLQNSWAAISAGYVAVEPDVVDDNPLTGQMAHTMNPAQSYSPAFDPTVMEPVGDLPGYDSDLPF